MSWLVSFSSLTPSQQDAVQTDTRAHKAIVGGPGAGKTLVLLHRLNLLFQRSGKNPDSVRLFVYTNSLKQFIRGGSDLLDVPEDCIVTFDKWCADTYRSFIHSRLPKGEKGVPDFEAIRAGVLHALESGRLRAPIFDYVLVDEAQDMDVVAIDILKRVGRHVTVCMDGKQQLYDGRMSEQELVTRIGLSRHNAVLLAAFRCNPMVTELAAQFIPDESRRREFLQQGANAEMDRSRPLLYVADNFADERAHLIEMVKLRLSYGDSIAVIFPLQRQVHGFAKGFAEAGIEVEVQKMGSPLDFSHSVPKLMTYHQAKGLTFDSVFLPRLDRSSFPDQMRERFGHLCFVGISRAVKWVYMSGENDSLIPAIQALYRADTSRFLDTKLSSEAVGLLARSVSPDTSAMAVDPFGLD